jgi:glycosyltransferase involved in cell wall biosynthesis
MRILFLTHYFPPEVNAPAVRTFEHCREWARAGHEVHVVTCVPSHPRGVAFPGYRRVWHLESSEDGIHVHRVWTYLAPNKGFFRRTLNYLSYVPPAVWRAARLGRFDVVIGTSPQFFCAAAAWLAARVRRSPWVFEVRDLWPESIPVVGGMRPSPLIRALERLELRLYASAAGVVCVTRAFIERLAARGVPRAKLWYVPNGIAPEFWDGSSRERARARLGLSGRDVAVVYAGTLGMAHGLESVLDAAAGLRAPRPEIRFVLAGDGAEADRLKASASARGLSNVSFAGQLPRDRMPALLAAADVVLVTLKPSELFETVLPSKLLEAMAARRPVVLAVGGEARQVLERAGAGIAVEPGSPAGLTAALLRLAGDPALRRAMGASGRRFVETEFNRREWAKRYAEILDAIAHPTESPRRVEPSPRSSTAPEAQSAALSVDQVNQPEDAGVEIFDPGAPGPPPGALVDVHRRDRMHQQLHRRIAKPSADAVPGHSALRTLDDDDDGDRAVGRRQCSHRPAELDGILDAGPDDLEGGGGNASGLELPLPGVVRRRCEVQTLERRGQRPIQDDSIGQLRPIDVGHGRRDGIHVLVERQDEVGRPRRILDAHERRHAAEERLPEQAASSQDDEQDQNAAPGHDAKV